MKKSAPAFRFPLYLLAAALTLALFSGCQTSPNDNPKNDGQLAKDARDTYRSLGQKVPEAYKTDAERANSRPGGLSEKEWRDISKE